MAELERICFPDPWSRNMLAEELDNALRRLSGGPGRRTDRWWATPGSRWCWTRAISPTWPSGRTAAARALPGKLLQVFLDFAEANGLAFLTLEVRAVQLRRPSLLYGSRGFRSVGRRKNYYEHPREDAIIMTKEFTTWN